MGHRSHYIMLRKIKIHFTVTTDSKAIYLFIHLN